MISEAASVLLDRGSVRAPWGGAVLLWSVVMIGQALAVVCFGGLLLVRDPVVAKVCLSLGIGFEGEIGALILIAGSAVVGMVVFARPGARLRA